MPRDLFGNVTRPSISIGNRKWYTVPVSLLSHAAIVLLLIAIPILAPSAMPSVFADDDPAWIKIDLPDPPPPVRPAAATPQPAADPNAFPTAAPIGITEEKPRQELSDPTGPDVVLGDPSSFTREVAPPPVVVAPPQEPVHIGGTIRQPQKVRNVDPVYPAIAQAARIQGMVIIEATLSPDGKMSNARILRSIPLLDQAALDAVRQWEYTPTLLNGVPVPVIMTITVMFTLSK